MLKFLATMVVGTIALAAFLGAYVLITWLLLILILNYPWVLGGLMSGLLAWCLGTLILENFPKFKEK